MHRTPWLALVLLLATASTASAQGFISPIPDMDPRQPSYVITLSGERFDGTIPMAMFVNGTLRSLTLKTSSGDKTRFKAADVAVLGHKPSALAKLAAMSEQVDNPWDMFSADWEGTMGREWVIFQQAILPGRAQKTALMQLLNPGFDRRIQVYYDAKAAGNDDTVMGISTAPAESYIVVKDGRQSIQVKKSKYKKQFAELFGDCAELMKRQEKKPKVKNFASAVYAFDKVCGVKGGASRSGADAAPVKTAEPARSSAPPRSQEPARTSAPSRSSSKSASSKRSGPVIKGTVAGYTQTDEHPLGNVRIELRPQTRVSGNQKSPAPDLLGLAITDAGGRFELDELHSKSRKESYPLLVGWSYEVVVTAAGHYVFNGVVEYDGKDEPWEFALEEKVTDVVDSTGPVGPDDRSLQRGATRRGNR